MQPLRMNTGANQLNSQNKPMLKNQPFIFFDIIIFKKKELTNTH
jgi:hypothetical protein